MKRVSLEIRESYRYNSYDEFVKHYNEMVEMGFEPTSTSYKPDYYTNLEMEHYFAEYYKSNI